MRLYDREKGEGDIPVKKSRSWSMVILRPLLVEVFENWEGCIGSGVGVVGKAKFLAVNELGK